MRRRSMLAAVTFALLAVAGPAVAATGEATEFTAGLSAGSNPVGIAAGADGALWFAELNANRIGRITTAGAINEYPITRPARSPSTRLRRAAIRGSSPPGPTGTSG